MLQPKNPTRTIAIKITTWQTLTLLKNDPYEPYDLVIQRLIQVYK